MEKSTMSVQELSAQMGISLPKAYELVKTEGFPAMRIGTRILISVDGFRKWLGLCDETDLAKKQEKLLAEMDVLESLMRKAVMENAETEQDQEDYASRYDSYVAKYEKLKKRYADAQEERQARQNKAQMLDGMIDGLRCAGPVAIGFDEKLWNATVDHVTVSRDGSMVFTMRDGKEIRIKR